MGALTETGVLKSRRVEQEFGDAAVEKALSIGLLTETDLLRLKAIARLHARGLPGGVGWTDLLHDSIVRALQGTRRRSPGLPMVAFLAGVMRSIKSEHWRRARREAQAHAQLLERSETAPDPERSVAAAQELALIDRLFADDSAALRIIAGLGEGLSADQIREVYGMSKTDYDSTRKRMRRVLLREGLAWRRP